MYVFALSCLMEGYSPSRLSPLRPAQAPKATTAANLGGWHAYPYGICHGEVLLWTAFTGFFVYWLYYWSVIFDYTEKKAHRLSHTAIETEVAAHVLGQVATLFTSMLLFPLSRTGLFVEIFGVPFDRCMK
jgi:hypothetical protein